MTEQETKILRMKNSKDMPYIDWVKEGKKTATTRKTMRPCGVYELGGGSYYHPTRSGVRIEITETLGWSRQVISRRLCDRICEAEGFNSWEEFLVVIAKINKLKEVPLDMYFWTHFFKVIL
jgi:hypothetical protein